MTSRALGYLLASVVALAGGVRAQCLVDTLGPNVTDGSAQFGASSAVSGTRAVVGAARGDGPAIFSGKAYVYELGPSGWNFAASLTASDGATDDWFGAAVAIEGDTILVGAYGIDGPLSGGVGAVYVYEWNGSQWVETQILQASDGQSGGFFGRAVAIEGDTAVIGRFYDSGPAPQAGSVHVFERGPAGFVEVAKLVASNAFAYAQFGWSVAISDGRIAIGAPERSAPAPQYGQAYVFSKIGGTWTETAMVDPATPLVGNQFGYAIDIEGDRLVVGAWQDTIAILNDGHGAAYVFDWNGNSWVESQMLTPSNGDSGWQFGASVTTHGEWLLIGSPSFISGPLFGSAYLYKLGSSGWTLQTQLFPNFSTSIGWFSRSLAMDGNCAIIGAPFETHAAFQDGGGYAYGGFDAWTDLGHALAGVTGLPLFTGAGTACGGTLLDWKLSNAAPGASATLVSGFTATPTPFKGGVLVPSPDIVTVGFATDGSGSVSFSVTWPTGAPSGFNLFSQFWIADAAGPQGFSASNAVALVTP